MNITVDTKKNKINKIPATVHIDGTARVQTVSSRDNKKFHNSLLNVLSHVNLLSLSFHEKIIAPYYYIF